MRITVLTPEVAKAAGYREQYLVLMETPENLYRYYFFTFDAAKALARSYGVPVRYL